MQDPKKVLRSESHGIINKYVLFISVQRTRGYTKALKVYLFTLFFLIGRDEI